METAQLRTLDVVAPDGVKYTIREQNGNDDDILSRVSDAKAHTSLSKFLAGIIVGPKLYGWEDIQENMGSATKYYLVLKSRIFTHGKEIQFKHTFQDGERFEFEEDLENFDDDLSSATRKKSEIAIIPYPVPFQVMQEFTTTSGKHIRYKMSTSAVEAETIKIPKENSSKNDELRARGLTQIIDTREMVITNFRDFSSRDMREIWADINKKDVNFALITPIKHPGKNLVEYISLLTVPEFFFPA